jgi:riboflavin-specific deaminase-like protein
VSEAAAGAPGPRFRALLPAREGELSAHEALAGWRDQARTTLRLALNMIASVDGRIAVGGRSAPLSSGADRSLFHALRAGADAVMAGGRTVRMERYGPIIRNRDTRATRVRAGLPEQPLAVIVTRRVDLDPMLPLLADPESRVVIMTPGQHDIPPCAAHVDYVRTPTLREGLSELAERHGVRTVVCEGGAMLNGSLAAEGLIDELFLAIAPMLVGESPGGGTLITGDVLPTPVPLELRALLRCASELYAHYVRAGADAG